MEPRLLEPLARVAAPVFLLTALLCATSVPGAPVESEPVDSLSGGPPLLLQDPAEPLQRKRPRSEPKKDRQRAAAYFATARTLYQRGQLDAALRAYQRAWRWDPDAVHILDEIVPLAFSLERSDEAVRYALIAAERKPTDLLLLRGLAVYAADTGDPQRAIRLHKLCLTPESLTNAESPVVEWSTWLEIARLEYLSGHAGAASQAAEKVQQAVPYSDPPTEAAQQLEQMLGDAANGTWEWCARFHLEADRVDLAQDALLRADATPDNSDTMAYLTARLAARQGKWGEARSQLERYFETRSAEESLAPYELLGEVLAQLGEAETLVTELERLHQADSRNPALSLALANQSMSTGGTARAIIIYRQIVEQRTPASHELAVRAVAKLIAYYGEQQQLSPLVDVLVDAVSNLESLVYVEKELRSLLADPQQVSLLLDYAEEHPAERLSANEAHCLAQLLIFARQYDRAAPYYRRAIDQSGAQGASVRYSWGLELYLAEQYAAAADVFADAARRTPREDPTAEYYLAAALAMDGRTERALEVAGQLVERFPESIGVAARHGWVLYQAGRYDEAIAAYTQLIAKFESVRDLDTRNELKDARFALSNLYVSQDDWQSSEEVLEEILDEFPEDAGALNGLGYTWADQDKHLGRALDMIRRALEAEPDNAAYRDSLGWVFYRMERYNDAVRELEAAVSLEQSDESSAGDSQEPDGVILDHLGDAYLKADRLQDAVAAWRRALPNFADSERRAAEATRAKLKQHGAAP